MRHRTRIAIVAAASGLGFAGVLQVAALLATQAGSVGLGRVVDWPTTLLHALVTNDALAIFGGFALGAVAYATIAYMIFRRALDE
jgi:hypothetical protein